jgi:hypothetical protein
LPVLGDQDGLISNVLQISGYDKVYSIKKSLILSEPSILCETFATLGLGGDGTSEERAVRLSNVTPEDFEALVHFYNDFESVML